LEVTVAGAADRDGSIMSLDELNGIVKRLVIDRLDHRHLNHDVEALRGINPTVENIACAVWQWLDGQFGNVQLARVRLYETPKTWADVTRGDAQIGSGRS
jgi:6-pyruvoyltetrahydropterin/6-carboxytetrahydropterin synthase